MCTVIEAVRTPPGKTERPTTEAKMKKKTTDQSSGKILDNPGRSRALRYTPQRWLGCRRHAEQRERSIRQSHRRNTGCRNKSRAGKIPKPGHSEQEGLPESRQPASPHFLKHNKGGRKTARK